MTPQSRRSGPAPATGTTSSLVPSRLSRRGDTRASSSSTTHRSGCAGRDRVLQPYLAGRRVSRPLREPQELAYTNLRARSRRSRSRSCGPGLYPPPPRHLRRRTRRPTTKGRAGADGPLDSATGNPCRKHDRALSALPPRTNGQWTATGFHLTTAQTLNASLRTVIAARVTRCVVDEATEPLRRR